jgi:antitoxin (DNA-binding transcriptional repressor) of toxin-antitoxin stability system
MPLTKHFALVALALILSGCIEQDLESDWLCPRRETFLGIRSTRERVVLRGQWVGNEPVQADVVMGREGQPVQVYFQGLPCTRLTPIAKTQKAPKAPREAVCADTGPNGECIDPCEGDEPCEYRGNNLLR